MIKSLTELDEQIKNGQQFEYYARGDGKWHSLDLQGVMFVVLVGLIACKHLRVKQVKE